MDILVRNITTNTEMSLSLPMPILELEEKLGKDEYIIIEEDGTLPISEYTHILIINTFLENCQEDSVDEETLAILTSAGLSFEDMVKAVSEDSYTIIDFTEETASWMTPDINNDNDKGLCLYSNGYTHLPFAYEESMQDYIDWAKVWRDAKCQGWTAIRYNNREYLVAA